MGKIKILFIAVIFLNFFNLTSDDADPQNKFNLNIEYNKSSGVMPSLDVLWNYNSFVFSSIYAGYYTKSEKKRLENFTESKYSIFSNTIVVGGEIVGFYVTKSPFIFAISIGGEYKRILTEEFGYFLLNDERVIFENNIKLHTFFPFLEITIDKKSEYVENRFNLSFFPSYFLNFNQDISFKPIITGKGKKSSNNWQVPALEISDDLIFNLKVFSILLSADFMIWQAKYTMQTLRNSESGYFYGENDIKQTFLEYSVSINVILPFKIVGNVRPMVGIGYSGSTVYFDEEKKQYNDYILNIGMYY
ncbi:MAG TPA: hypothetical protein PL056_13865 [bacterium]|nr:hypothetical protein [bacterium]